MLWVYDDWFAYPRLYRVREQELDAYWDNHDFSQRIVFEAELVME